MDPGHRTLLRVGVSEAEVAAEAVKALMGTSPETRFNFIQENAAFATDLDI